MVRKLWMALVQAMPSLPASSRGEPQLAGQAQAEMRRLLPSGSSGYHLC
jgi:hypothetical protein